MYRYLPYPGTTAPPPPGTVLRVTFTVGDTGIGLAAANRDRLFEPFVQASQGGCTGLGLSISRQFVPMLGDDITVESQPGQGATFAFTVPMSVVEAEQIQQATLRLDGDQLTQIMAQFTPTQTPLAAWLAQQIDQFAFDTIYTAVQQAKG
ncbi:hypothetical protein C8255_25570 [filamentous cyanobacterium CCP3]|nr:hypothetical protein C8255_25570 [filamentous cyanobacterium CCP3]